jgi:hypothetical protein
MQSNWLGNRLPVGVRMAGRVRDKVVLLDLTLDDKVKTVREEIIIVKGEVYYC